MLRLDMKIKVNLLVRTLLIFSLISFLFPKSAHAQVEEVSATLTATSCTSNEISFDFHLMLNDIFLASDPMSRYLGYYYNHPQSGGSLTNPVIVAYADDGDDFPAGQVGMTYRIVIPNSGNYYQNGDSINISMAFVNWMWPSCSTQYCNRSCIFDPSYIDDNCNENTLSASCTYVDLNVAPCKNGGESCLSNDECCSDSCDQTLGICYSPPTQCTGALSGLPGECHFMRCPADMYFDGFTPPMNTGCTNLHACCTARGSGWINKSALSPRCTRNGQVGINTAIGCIPITNPTNLLTFVLPWAIGVAGGVAFILIIIAAFVIMTSAGDPQKAKAGKELLGAAIAGLLMIIFSVYLLDVIGIRIIRLPGL